MIERRMWQRLSTVARSDVLPQLAPYGVAIALLLVLGGISPTFLSLSHITELLIIASFLGLVSASQTLVMLVGGIDLSVSYVITAAAVVAAIVYPQLAHKVPQLVLLVGVLGLCGAIGLVNGLGVALLRIPPIIMTLGMNSVIQGALLIYTNGSPGGSAPPLAVTAGATVWAIILWLFVTVLLYVLLQRTAFGRHVYAVGSRPRVAFLSGVPVRRVTMILYVTSGLCAGLAGILLGGYSGEAYIGMGDSYLLPSIVAVVLGGTSILGGRGSYVGTVGGVLLLTFLTTLLNNLNLSLGWQEVIYGTVILCALTIYGRSRAARV